MNSRINANSLCACVTDLTGDTQGLTVPYIADTFSELRQNLSETVFGALSQRVAVPDGETFTLSEGEMAFLDAWRTAAMACTSTEALRKCFNLFYKSEHEIRWIGPCGELATLDNEVAAQLRADFRIEQGAEDDDSVISEQQESAFLEYLEAANVNG